MNIRIKESPFSPNRGKCTEYQIAGRNDKTMGNINGLSNKKQDICWSCTVICRSQEVTKQEWGKERKKGRLKLNPSFSGQYLVNTIFNKLSQYFCLNDQSVVHTGLCSTFFFLMKSVVPTGNVYRWIPERSHSDEQWSHKSQPIIHSVAYNSKTCITAPYITACTAEGVLELLES